MKKKAFTIHELLICLGVIGIVALLTVTKINVNPNKNMALFRKAYNITANIVYEMMQSNAYYNTSSFSDTKQTSEPIEDGTKPSGNTKFCEIFASFINTYEAPNCTADANPTFISLDGIYWYMPISDFSTKQKIKIDVNGTDGPNCEEEKKIPDTNEDCNDPDIFYITIRRSGKIEIEGDIARKYLQNNKTLMK